MIPRDCRRFLRVLERRYGSTLVSVVLFGSVAKGRPRRDSDIDLLVVRKGWPKSRLNRHGQVFGVARRVSEEFAHRVSVVPLTPQEAQDVKPFYLGMLSGHQLLFDRGGFFRTVLERLTHRLNELGARRYAQRDGSEYWILKPDLKLGEAVVL